MKTLKISLLAVAAAVVCGLASCVCHHFDTTAPFKVGHVLCSDGTVLSLCEYVKTDKEAIGIVFKVNADPNATDLGYAVCIHDVGELAFADELNVKQGTSCSLDLEDGNTNTYAIYSTEDVKSPMANLVFNLWPYGQSAYVPSVAQLRLLFANKDFVNRRIEAVGGEPILEGNEDCWMWSSTEVDGQQADKAWLFSMNYGSIQETPKNQPHKVRPIVTIKK